MKIINKRTVEKRLIKVRSGSSKLNVHLGSWPLTSFQSICFCIHWLLCCYLDKIRLHFDLLSCFCNWNFLSAKACCSSNNFSFASKALLLADSSTYLRFRLTELALLLLATDLPPIPAWLTESSGKTLVPGKFGFAHSTPTIQPAIFSFKRLTAWYSVWKYS